MKAFPGLVIVSGLFLTPAARADEYNEGVSESVIGGNAQRYWHWVVGRPAFANPLYDTTGEYADDGQKDSVWLLAGSDGETVTRDVTVPSDKFLFFPDENHWVLTPQHAKIWYSTVLAFLDTTVCGAEWSVPDALR
jgi:hypothetical protein